MINNCKVGRKISRHDDGSYLIHDEDGNVQFKHPSGLDIRIGSSTDDIVLELPFPDHAKNVADYDEKVVIKVKHPSGSILEYDEDGIFDITRGTGENLKTIIDSFITEVSKIVVANGTGPDVAALTQLQADLALLLK